MHARIYQPSRNAMQSGMARTRQWILEFAPQEPRDIDPLMGWTSSSDMDSQVRIRFDTKEEALTYAKENGIEVQVMEPKRRKPNVRPMGYGENFATNRRGAWTH
ncbi:NADH dehydrogenase [Poseidonocella pacifica]|uniref:NADH dehydrogenase n=1 Tax=Poseidonocella pacifica TaxID=871651 RepID=A0A1I0WIT3_9RHOB|nr:ETC complex I subunit [Poseidonocella pacifica]SFA88138.1 NADH dehydrogenase [Poseidonocella pacifica]